jgi:hypothetical protein
MVLLNFNVSNTKNAFVDGLYPLRLSEKKLKNCTFYSAISTLVELEDS